MQLRNNLYTLSGQEPEGEGMRFRITLRADHTIYRAHFPGQPVTPGVCIVQTACELLELLVARQRPGVRLELEHAKNVKFLSVVSPLESTDVEYLVRRTELSDDGQRLHAQVTVLSLGETKAKLSLTLRLI